MMGCGLATQLWSLRKQPIALGTALAVGTSSPPKQESLLGLPLGFSAIYPLEEELGPVPGKAPSL